MSGIYLEYNLPIYFARNGETPHKGAFFAVDKNWNLSRIAKAVYNDSSAWKIINKNTWNMSNLVYRADSTNCNSNRRESSLALTTMSPNATTKSAFISLCQRDAKQIISAPPELFNYPVVWIPDLDTMVVPVRRGEEPPTQPVQIIDHAKLVIPTIPGKPSNGNDSGGGSGGGTVPGAPRPQEAGMSPWMLVGVGVLMLGGLLLWPTSTGKKKGRRR